MAFREFMYAGRKFPGDDKGRIFKIDRLAKLLELQEDCVYVSSTKDDYAENAQVFIVYHSKNSNDWNLSYLDQMDIDYDKVDGYGTFEQLANKLNKHIHEST